jgi:acyl-CoA thioesterase
VNATDVAVFWISSTSSPKSDNRTSKTFEASSNLRLLLVMTVTRLEWFDDGLENVSANSTVKIAKNVNNNNITTTFLHYL